MLVQNTKVEKYVLNQNFLELSTDSNLTYITDTG